MATTVATPSKWPGRAAPSSGWAIAPTVTVVSKPARVDLPGGRGEDQVDALLLAHLEVAGLVPRVLRVVRRNGELARVDEDRDHGRAVGGPCLADQRAVALVQPAHRGDEADRPRDAVEGVTQRGSGSNDPGQAGEIDR